MSDMQIVKRLEKARFDSSTDGTLANTAGNCIAAIHTREQGYNITDANAAANLAETPVGVVTLANIASSQARFISGNVTPPANLVANTTNYVTVNIYRRASSNYAASVLFLTANLTANVAAWTPTALALANSANATVSYGDVLTVQLVKGGSGGFLANGAAALIDTAFEDV